MKFQRQILCVLPVVMLVCSVLSAPAQAQFYQQGPKLVGTGAIFSSQQGLSVSLSGDGNTAIVGGPNDNRETGAAWVFTRSGGVWSQQAKLVDTAAAEQGRSVSLSADGNTAIVGGPGDNNGVGAAWVFTRAAGVWSQQAKLVGTGATGEAMQGDAVSLSGDGNTAIVGGPDAAAAWVFTRSSGVWGQQATLVGAGELGISVSLSGDGNTVVGGGNDNGGVFAASVFTRSGGVWSQQAELVGTGATGRHFKAIRCRFPLMGIPLSSAGLVTAVMSVPRGCSSARAECGASWDPS